MEQIKEIMVKSGDWVRIEEIFRNTEGYITRGSYVAHSDEVDEAVKAIETFSQKYPEYGLAIEDIYSVFVGRKKVVISFDMLPKDAILAGELVNHLEIYDRKQRKTYSVMVSLITDITPLPTTLNREDIRSLIELSLALKNKDLFMEASAFLQYAKPLGR